MLVGGGGGGRREERAAGGSKQQGGSTGVQTKCNKKTKMNWGGESFQKTAIHKLSCMCGLGCHLRASFSAL